MSFVLGGKRADELGLVMLRQSQRPVLPGTVDRTMQIAGRHGAWDFGADLQPRLFNLECAFITNNSVELQQKISELAGFLMDFTGRPRSLSLYFLTQPDRTYTVRYSGTLPIDRVAGLGRFTLPLVAYDPFAYGSEKVLEETFASNPFEVEVDSDGTVDTPPIIMLRNLGGSTITSFSITSEILVHEEG